MSEKGPVVVEGNNIYVLQPGMKIFVKTADMCSLLNNKSNQWVGQLTSQGTLTKTKTSHGSMYELKQNLPEYCEMLEDRRPEITEEDTKIEKTKRAAEAKLKASKAVIATLEADELKGKMHRADDIKVLTEDMIYAIRHALLSLPGRLAVDTAAAGTAAETSDIIRKEVHKVMQELANYQYDPAKYEERVRDRRDWDKAQAEDEDE